VARARNIKPGLFKNEILGVADPLCALLFVGLWTLADREGRLEDRPLRIKGELFPYRDGVNVGELLSWLEREGFIRRYVAGGKALIQILQFAKHQTPHGTEKDSDLPDENGLFTVHVRGKNGYATGDSSLVNRGLTVKQPSENLLIPDSGFLIPDSGLPEEPAAAPPPPSKPKKSKGSKTEMPEGFGISARVRAWAADKGYGQLEAHLESFVAKCEANAYTYANWDSAFMEAIRQDWAKLRGKTANGTAPPAEGSHRDAAEETARMLADKDRGARPPPAHIRAQIAEALKGKVLQ
jgi:hypothetical protein